MTVPQLSRRLFSLKLIALKLTGVVASLVRAFRLWFMAARHFQVQSLGAKVSIKIVLFTRDARHMGPDCISNDVAAKENGRLSTLRSSGSARESVWLRGRIQKGSSASRYRTYLRTDQHVACVRSMSSWSLSPRQLYQPIPPCRRHTPSPITVRQRSHRNGRHLPETPLLSPQTLGYPSV